MVIPMMDDILSEAVILSNSGTPSESAVGDVIFDALEGYLNDWHTYDILHVATLLGFRRYELRDDREEPEIGSPPSEKEALDMLVNAAEWYLYEDPKPTVAPEAETPEVQDGREPESEEEARLRRRIESASSSRLGSDTKEKFRSNFRAEAQAMLTAMDRKALDLLNAKEARYDGYEQFWVHHKNTFPQCFSLYRIVLSAPATSSAVESLFSAVSNVYADTRLSMLPQRLGNAWSRVPPSLKNGRRGIEWPTNEKPLESAKILRVVIEEEEDIANNFIEPAGEPVGVLAGEPADEPSYASAAGCSAGDEVPRPSPRRSVGPWNRRWVTEREEGTPTLAALFVRQTGNREGRGSLVRRTRASATETKYAED
jgi:hypothetical protein